MANNEDKLIEALADVFNGFIVRYTDEEREEIALWGVWSSQAVAASRI